MGLPQENVEKIYTYADYSEWELAEGAVLEGCTIDLNEVFSKE
jgi:hypothetical protein